MASHLSSGRVNLSVLRESYRREFLELLDKCQGTKALVWDGALTGPFDLIADYTLLQEHEVERMWPLHSGRLPSSDVKNIIFITRAKCSLMEIIGENIPKQGNDRKEYHIFFLPRKSLLCEKKLKDLGIHGSFTTIEEYCLDIVPMDYDLLSMEMEMSFRNCCLENDHTTLFFAAKSLMTLQALYGIIPNVYGKGDLADEVIDLMMRMRRELAGREPQITPQIDNLFIIDRIVDPLTPLMTQLTYEGLTDEIFGINNTFAKFPPQKFNANSTEEATTTDLKKVRLNSAEELFVEIRDRNFNAVGNVLSKKAKLISAQYDERHSAKTVGEMKQFVSKLPHMQAAKTSLGIHTAIAELIKEITDTDEFRASLVVEQEFLTGLDTDKTCPYIEDCISKQESLIKILRLICIQCYCNCGFKPKVLEYYKREIIQTYGFEHLLTLHNLEKVGLLRLQGTFRHYATIKKSLKLIVEEVNEQNPNDISYVFSGYAPLSIRLAHVLHRPGWRSIKEVLNLLPGRTREEVQQIPGWLRKRRTSGGSVQSSGGSDQKVTIIFFLGGVTYAEVSALRFLSQLEDGPTEYIVATTKLINGTTWIESMMDVFHPKPLNPF